MNRGRETVYTALFAQIQKVAGFNLISRVPIPSDALATANMPALEVLGEQEDAVFTRIGVPIIWKVRMDLMIYCDTSDTTVPAYTTLNNLIDAVELALKPNPQGKVELPDANGIPIAVDVHFAGTILKDPSFQSGIGAAAVPIEIITTA